MEEIWCFHSAPFCPAERSALYIFELCMPKQTNKKTHRTPKSVGKERIAYNLEYEYDKGSKTLDEVLCCGTNFVQMIVRVHVRVPPCMHT